MSGQVGAAVIYDWSADCSADVSCTEMSGELVMDSSYEPGTSSEDLANFLSFSYSIDDGPLVELIR